MMILSKTKKYTLIKPTQKTVKEFLQEFEKKSQEFINEHLIIDFSNYFNTKIKEILLFLDKSKEYKQRGTSFVLIFKDIDIDSIPEEINVVPTFKEALDIIEMDAIERDLGF